MGRSRPNGEVTFSAGSTRGVLYSARGVSERNAHYPNRVPELPENSKGGLQTRKAVTLKATATFGISRDRAGNEVTIPYVPIGKFRLEGRTFKLPLPVTEKDREGQWRVTIQETVKEALLNLEDDTLFVVKVIKSLHGIISLEYVTPLVVRWKDHAKQQRINIPHDVADMFLPRKGQEVLDLHVTKAKWSGTRDELEQIIQEAHIDSNWGQD